jgi:transcription elongation factor GreA
MYEETYPDRDGYVLVDLRGLPGRQLACQFECCFQGSNDAETVTGRYLESAAPRSPASAAEAKPPRGGIIAGQTVVFLDLHSGETRTRTVVGGRRADPSKAEVSAESPIGRALVGRRIGDVVRIDLPRGPLRVEVREILP